MNYEEAKIVVEETEKLQQLRRDLDTLKKDEKKYLVDRKEKEERMLGGVYQAIRTGIGLLGDLNSYIVKRLGGLKRADIEEEKARIRILGKAEELVKAAEHLKELGGKFLAEAERRMKESDERTEALSNREKQLDGRAKEVDKIATEAEVKLKEAQDLAFWAKKPGATYRDARKGKK